MSDTPEERAQRVEKILETGDLDKAMKTLNDEMAHVSNPDERAAVLRSLKDQNDKANQKDWTVPNVTIEQNTEWLGLVKKDGEYNVEFSQNVFEKIGKAEHEINPFYQVGKALEQQTEDK